MIIIGCTIREDESGTVIVENFGTNTLEKATSQEDAIARVFHAALVFAMKRVCPDAQPADLPPKIHKA